MLSQIYKPSLFLATDLYQLTTIYSQWKSGLAEKECVFNLTFRANPFNGGYTICAGLEMAIDYMKNLCPNKEDLEYLKSLKADNGKQFFDPKFIHFLADWFNFSGGSFRCDVHAIPEGTVVFPQEPLIRVRGPAVQCQLMESILINIINFQTLIATKAARICMAAKEDPVMEFGLRRAQGIDGALSASRAAYIGGCSSTSNVLAGRLFGIPVKGTHPHSWIMLIGDELEAFKLYAKAMPDNCVFLVDTYDTLKGVEKAIEVGKWLKENGHKMIGIRLDSGDLAWLSCQARKMLDKEGFEDSIIIASNDLDEYTIESLKNQNAKIAVWGVGTRLVTAYDQPTLGGVYKLSAANDNPSDGLEMNYRMKLSEQQIKMSNPGIIQVRRFVDSYGNYRGDMIYDEQIFREKRAFKVVDISDPTRQATFLSRSLDGYLLFTDLLRPIFDKGKLVYNIPSLNDIKAYSIENLGLFYDSIKRYLNPHLYMVGLEEDFHKLRQDLIFDLRRGK